MSLNSTRWPDSDLVSHYRGKKWFHLFFIYVYPMLSSLHYILSSWYLVFFIAEIGMHSQIWLSHCWMKLVSPSECLLWMALFCILDYCLCFGCYCLHTEWLTLVTHGWLMLLTHWLMLNAITAQSMIWMCMLLYQTKCLTFFIVYTAELDEQLDQGNTQNTVSWSFFSFTNACFTISNSWGRLMSRLWCIVVTPDFGV